MTRHKLKYNDEIQVCPLMKTTTRPIALTAFATPIVYPLNPMKRYLLNSKRTIQALLLLGLASGLASCAGNVAHRVDRRDDRRDHRDYRQDTRQDIRYDRRDNRYN